MALLLGAAAWWWHQTAGEIDQPSSDPSAIDAFQGTNNAAPSASLQAMLRALPEPPMDLPAPSALPSPGQASRQADAEDFALASTAAEGSSALRGDVPGFLARARAGDTAAAAELGAALVACASLFDELERIEAQLHPDRMGRAQAELDAVAQRAEDRLDSDFMRRRMENCEGVSRDNLDLASELLEQAARSGDALAADLYVTYWIGRLDHLATDPAQLMRFRANASAFMHRDAARCIPSAILRLQHAYQHGTFEYRDPVMVLAFGSVFGWLLGRSEVEVSSLAPTLSASDILRAQALANQFYDLYCR
jgi:hypothetical protein